MNQLDQNIAVWLAKAGFTLENTDTIPSSQFYALYKEQLGDQAVTKRQFTRSMKSLGFERKSKRFPDNPSKVDKAYVHTRIKPCPNCNPCSTCNNKRFIKSS